MLENECCWAGDVLDELLIVAPETELYGFTPAGSVGGFLNRAVAALNLGGPVLTSELSDATLPRSRPGAAAFMRAEAPTPG